jgi:predicted phage terminase large subunit-like protein
MKDFPICRQAMSLALREDFGFFVERVFLTLNPSERLKWNWHIEAMCHGLDQVRRGENKRLVITVPPRHLKSITVSVAFVAWTMGQDPTLKFLVASYGGELAAQLARDFQRIVLSPWYREAFPGFGTPRRNAEGDLVTAAGGYRRAVSVGGATTGFGADYIIVDDLMKATDAASPATREATRDYYQGSLISRLNDQEAGRIIVIAQRLHEDDLPGHCIETGLFRHINLPAIAPGPELVPVGRGKVHARCAGDLLFPAFQSRETLDRIRIEQGPTYFSAQYLQDPTPAESNLIRWHDIQRYETAPPRRRLQKVVQSWDTAETDGARSDYSACSTWGYCDGRWALLDVTRFKAGFRELVARARMHRDQWKPDLILIEDAGSGRHLLQEFNHERRTSPESRAPSWKLHRCLPSASKMERWAAQAAKLEGGFALLPQDAPWLEALRREVTGFPNARHDDQVDSLGQFLAWTSSARVAVGLAREFNEGPKTAPSKLDDDDLGDADGDWFRSGRAAPDRQLLTEQRWSHQSSGTPSAISR